jgi:ribosomal protein S24E
MIIMEMKIESETVNPFFKRKELTVELRHSASATPRKADLAKELALKFKVDESQVIVDYIVTGKGETRSVAKAKILDEKPAAKEDASKAASASQPAAADAAPQAPVAGSAK